jgi:TolB-like protein/Tfp pilus assembly protein PilF
LEKNPEQRFQSSSDLAFALDALSDSSAAAKPSSGKPTKAIDSLAILPLENASGDPETEYLSDGIAETLIHTLAQLRKIRVVPRTLAFRYRGPVVDPLAAGRELGVKVVLSGRMMQRGDYLIVSVDLLDVDRQAQLWGGRYNRKMTDLIMLQEELVTEISEKLRLQLTGDEKRKLRKRPTQNNEAYKLLLRAWHAASKFSPEKMRQAIAFCEQAIDIDPTYAAAHASLSVFYTSPLVMAAPAAEAFSRARAAAKKALELDETLAEAHFSMGIVLAHLSWDFAGAEREFRRSVELNPDYWGGHSGLAYLNRFRGRFDDAIVGFKRTIDLEPLEMIAGMATLHLGVTYYYAHRFENAIEQFRKVREIEAGNVWVRTMLADAYACAGQREKAIEECEQALALSRHAIGRLTTACTYARIGKTEEARRILVDVESAWNPGDSLSSFFVAAAHARVGEKDAAFEWLEKVFQRHEPFLTDLKVHPVFDSLHGDPRFDDLVKRIGIPD